MKDVFACMEGNEWVNEMLMQQDAEIYVIWKWIIFTLTAIVTTWIISGNYCTVMKM
jgi:hypothetical protein